MSLLERSSLPRTSGLKRLLSLSFLLLLSGLLPCCAKDRWTELNLGPFYVATDGEIAAARNTLTQLEQLRWVLGNLLEAKQLPSLWPIRIMLMKEAAELNSGATFRWQYSQYIATVSPGSRLPLAEVAGLLLDANTPRLPPEVETGLRKLFSSLEAHGSHVTWGGPVPDPDLAWARMQLFATKFEYGASFHIFLTALKNGSTLAGAERNAFGKSPSELELEVRANLESKNWTAVPVSGRPLDPKRDFGEHSLDGTSAGVYLADLSLAADREQLEAACRAAIGSGAPAAALGFEGLATLAKQAGEDSREFLENAIRSGSLSANVYVSAAGGLPKEEALPLLKRAAQLNDRWAEPVYRQAELAATQAEKEKLLQAALVLDPRATDHWIELAELQTNAGEGTAAQGSWLRAESSAPNEAERDRVHQLREAGEQRRLDASAESERRERDAPRIADLRAQRAEERRIHAAEQKANQSLNAAANGEKPSNVVAWSSLEQEKKLKGTLTHVDCLKNGWRLLVKDKSGSQIALLLPKESKAALSCTSAAVPRQVSVSYHTAADEDLHTAGEITSLEIQ